MVELAYRGGTVADRLIGDHWLRPSALAPSVRAMVRGQRERRSRAQSAAGFVEPGLRAEFPGLRIDWLTVAPGWRRRSPASVQRPPRATVEPLPRRRAWWRCGRSRSRTPTVRSSTRSGSTPTTADSQRAGCGRPAASRAVPLAKPARGRAADCAASRPACRCGRWTPDRVEPAPASASARPRLAIDSDPPNTRIIWRRVASWSPTRRCVHAVLFGELAPGHEVERANASRIGLFTVGVDGVPAIHIEEALWVCDRDALRRVGAADKAARAG